MGYNASFLGHWFSLLYLSLNLTMFLLVVDFSGTGLKIDRIVVNQLLFEDVPYFATLFSK